MNKSRFVAVALLLVLSAALVRWVMAAPTVITVHCEATESAPTACGGSGAAKPLHTFSEAPDGPVNKPGANSNGSLPINKPKEI
jgi:hypothetical protein